MKDIETADLPIGWVKTTIGGVCTKPQYGWTTRANRDSGNVLLLRTTDISDGQLDWSKVPYCEEEPKELEKYLLKSGDIVISRAGSVGISYLLNVVRSKSVFASYLIRFCPDETLADKKYVYYFLKSPDYWASIADNTAGIAVPNVNASKLEQIEFPLPPLPEQHRIVTKIEELFSELDKGIESFKTAREQLKVYRQALLKHAFEGKLTAAWREENEDKLESADVLLKRIQAERAERYRQQVKVWEKGVKEWEKGGKQGSKPGKPSQPKELPPLTAEELAELPELPKGWGWVKLGHLAWSVKDGPHYSPKYADKGVPFISGGNIRPEGVDFNNVKYITTELHAELCKRCKPEKNDILYTKGGTTGIARVNTYDNEFSVWVHVAVLKLLQFAQPFFIQHALNTSFCYTQSQKFTHGVGNQDLGLTRMINIVLPICSIYEQTEVTTVVDDKLSVIDDFDQTITTALQQAEALRQSILKKAFSGQLVPQDPNDEPAAALLARIKAEKTAIAASLKDSKAAKTVKAKTPKVPKTTRKKVNK